MIIKAISGKVSPSEVLYNNNECIIHFLDIENSNITKEYLKSAWSAGSLRKDHIYLANMGPTDHLSHLNFSEIFDFQRLYISLSYKVQPSFQLTPLDKIRSATFQRNIRKIIHPSEFWKNEGLFHQVSTWAPKTGYQIIN